MGLFNHGSPTTDVDGDAERIGDNIDQEGWKMAEQAVLSRVGGWAGVSEEAKYRQIKEAYDQLVENNKAAAVWEGKEEDSGM